MASVGLADRALSYGEAGVTAPGDAVWTAPAGRRAYERCVRVGHGDETWAQARAAFLCWGVKTRSGFAIEPASGSDPGVRDGADYWLVAAVGPLRIREPARVVGVVDRPDRCGFSYGTLEGHPVSGEEAFVLHRDGDGVVRLTLRSVTAPGAGRWRLAFPEVLVAQRWYRRRYARALAAG
ncbi:Uncharacterized protein, UPF0548 family [Blastococcus aurantiacus]|uniref:Uncharacterized protein, UPF0548 family n=1 Tax=Blastococcus aurantiacus TaxID=1550231 RepID=A0A1G7P362_9ACTN|nr:DUF1990 domain-containing protein [Blastococcus aurantiacus]SDF80671.1 Uncharacterized protein, UPF0548 family [Blastococcus aurantiacus]